MKKMRSVAQPTFRNALEKDALSGTFEQMIRTAYVNNLHGWRLAGSWDDAGSVIIAHMETAGGLPMARVFYAPRAVHDLMFDALHQFHKGLISAERAAQDMQNGVALAALEGG